MRYLDQPACIGVRRVGRRVIAAVSVVIISVVQLLISGPGVHGQALADGATIVRLGEFENCSRGMMYVDRGSSVVLAGRPFDARPHGNDTNTVDIPLEVGVGGGWTMFGDQFRSGYGIQGYVDWIFTKDGEGRLRVRGGTMTAETVESDPAFASCMTIPWLGLSVLSESYEGWYIGCGAHWYFPTYTLDDAALSTMEAGRGFRVDPDANARGSAAVDVVFGKNTAISGIFGVYAETAISVFGTSISLHATDVITGADWATSRDINAGALWTLRIGCTLNFHTNTPAYPFSGSHGGRRSR